MTDSGLLKSRLFSVFNERRCTANVEESMWRLTSADKGRTNTVASFRHGGKNQTGVALAAKVLRGAAAQKLSCGSKQSHSGCRCFPHKQTHKLATLFLIRCPFFLMMLHTFFSHPLPLSLSFLSSCISSAAAS